MRESRGAQNDEIQMSSLSIKNLHVSIGDKDTVTYQV